MCVSFFPCDCLLTVSAVIYQAAQEFPEAREKLGAPTDFQFVNITPESWQNWAENGVKLDETPQSTGGNPFEDDDYELTLEPKRKRKKDEAKIPRWPNAFICFRRVILAKGYVSVELAQDNRTLSKICGAPHCNSTRFSDLQAAQGGYGRTSTPLSRPSSSRSPTTFVRSTRRSSPITSSLRSGRRSRRRPQRMSRRHRSSRPPPQHPQPHRP